MHVLFIGDIVGRPGRKCVRLVLPGLIKRRRIDFIVANGENAAGGSGITKAVCEELKGLGLNVITGGNHIWDNKEVLEFIDGETCLLRPANYPPDTPGRGAALFECQGYKIGVINLSGRVFMQPLDCPFHRAEMEVKALRRETNIILVDFHAEATSEKQALGWLLDGAASAVIGTHTHIQTADERLLHQGTAYITDAGMTGLRDSILGVDREPALRRFLSQRPDRLTISAGRMQFNAVSVQIEPETGRALSINRYFEVVD